MLYDVSARILVLANGVVDADSFEEAKQKADRGEFIKDEKGCLTDWAPEDWLDGPVITVISDENGKEKTYNMNSPLSLIK